jgi:hypothetical protein
VLQVSDIRRLVIAAVAVAALAFAALGAAAHPANAAGTFCFDQTIASGTTCVHTASHEVIDVNGHATGSAVACVGVSAGAQFDWSNWCAPYGGGTAQTPSWTRGTATGPPEMHNHSSWGNVFRGYFNYYS